MSASRDPNEPVVPPPPGQVSNFDNPPNGNAAMNAVVALSIVLTLLTFGLRFYGQLFLLKRRPYLEEYVILPALAGFIGCCATVLVITHSTGYFVHGWNMRVGDLTHHRFIIFLTTTFYNFAMIFLKTAILIQWARIFVPGKKNIFYWLCYVIALANMIFYAATILIEWLRCRPVQFYWDRTIDGKCAKVDNLSPISAILNLVFDVLILLLPQKAIWGLNMSFKKKLGVAVVFLVGILACVCASIRLSFALGYLSGGDFTYDPSWQVILGVLELLCGFLTFSLPVLPKPFSLLVEQSRSSINRFRSSKGTWNGSTMRSRNSRNKSAQNTLDDTQDRGFVPLKEMHVKQTEEEDQSPLSPHAQSFSRSPQNRVLRNTRFDITETTVSYNNKEDVFPQQHPWAQGGSRQ